MKKFFLFVLVLGAGFLAYKAAFAKSSAFRAYETFADALLFDRWGEANRLAGSDDVEAFVADRMTLPEMLGHQNYKNLKGRVHMGPSRTIESEMESADGKRVTVRVTQETREGPLTMAPVGPSPT